MTESPTALTEGGTPTGIVGGFVAVVRGPLVGWMGRDGGCVCNVTTGSAGVGSGVARGLLTAADGADVDGDAAGAGDVGAGDVGAGSVDVRGAVVADVAMVVD
jgi:hypothetical protein